MSYLEGAKDALGYGDDKYAQIAALIAIAEELHRMNERNEPQTMTAEDFGYSQPVSAPEFEE